MKLKAIKKYTLDIAYQLVLISIVLAFSKLFMPKAYGDISWWFVLGFILVPVIGAALVLLVCRCLYAIKLDKTKVNPWGIPPPKNKINTKVNMENQRRENWIESIRKIVPAEEFTQNEQLLGSLWDDKDNVAVCYDLPNVIVLTGLPLLKAIPVSKVTSKISTISYLNTTEVLKLLPEFQELDRQYNYKDPADFSVTMDIRLAENGEIKTSASYPKESRAVLISSSLIGLGSAIKESMFCHANEKLEPVLSGKEVSTVRATSPEDLIEKTIQAVKMSDLSLFSFQSGAESTETEMNFKSELKVQMLNRPMWLPDFKQYDQP